jgi:Ala-tRNA(Pro) deacylase
MQVADFLSEHRVAFEHIIHPPAFTAQKRAKFLHTPGSRVAKAVLLAGPRGYLLAVLPATHHVDTRILARHLEGPVRLADDHEIAEVFTDCEWGVVVPFGPLYGLQTFLDESLDPDHIIVLEGNTRVEAVRMSCRDFERLVQPRRLGFTRERIEK